jgi:hypothetical protein
MNEPLAFARKLVLAHTEAVPDVVAVAEEFPLKDGDHSASLDGVS